LVVYHTKPPQESMCLVFGQLICLASPIQI
jgi:hypothetical protein